MISFVSDLILSIVLFKKEGVQKRERKKCFQGSALGKDPVTKYQDSMASQLIGSFRQPD